jgi:dephospho-CoA kinase
MEKMKIIAFTGMPFSGKTEAVKIAKEMGFSVVRMGDAVWSEVANRGLKLNDENVGSVADSMRKDHGYDIWAKRTIVTIKSMEDEDCIVIDGVRNSEEIDFFREKLGNDFLLVSVNSSEEIRRKRAMLRNRKDDSKNFCDIEERDRRELRWGMGSVIASADVIIENDKSLNDFHKQVHKFLSKFC